MVPSSVWQWLKKTVQMYWSSITLIVLVTFAVAAASAAWPMLWQHIMDEATSGHVNGWIVATFVVLFMANNLPFAHLLRLRFLNRHEFYTRYRLFKHLLRLSIPFHKDKESTKVLLEADKGVAAGNRLLSIFLQGDILADIPVSIFSMWYVGSQSLSALGILLLFLFVFFGLSYVLGSKVAKVEEEYQELSNNVSTHQREVMQYIETVKLHQAESQEEEWLKKEGGKLLELNHRLNAYEILFHLMAGLAHALPFGIVLILFLPNVAEGTLSIGTLIALQIFSAKAVAPAGFLGNMYRDIRSSIARLKPALNLMKVDTTVSEAKNPVQMLPLRHELSVRDLTFTYPGVEKPTLSGVSLTIAAGEKVALVGKTGSGKTTLARMLVRFYDPTHGIVTADGTDLRQISFDSLYRQVSYVTQEVSIFSGTIGENVSYGLSDSSKDGVATACNHASADFVFTRSHGLDTKVGELGEKLSGGERQRLALARVFLRKPSMVILDEATASLDRITEREVQSAFDQLLQMNGGTTMVVIAHRITTVKNADRIVVLDQGRIIDSGTHDELLQRCSLYQELCREME